MPAKRLFTMFLGWTIAFYGIRRRDLPGTIMALSGLGLAYSAMTLGEADLPTSYRP